jgi:hypothetical protein
MVTSGLLEGLYDNAIVAISVTNVALSSIVNNPSERYIFSDGEGSSEPIDSSTELINQDAFDRIFN